MKTIFLSCLIVLTSFLQSRSQVINQLTITPANPTASDTITVIWDLTYTGNCAFGMVSVYSFVNDSTITIAPTYCGYFDTTVCNSIDTFKIEPVGQGNYTIQMEFHQGSICPLSGFDALIAQLDTNIVVTPLSGLPENHHHTTLTITPNPANDHLTIDGLAANSKIQICDSTGKIVIEEMTRSKNNVLDISKLRDGVYFLKTENGVKKIVKM